MNRRQFVSHSLLFLSSAPLLLGSHKLFSSEAQAAELLMLDMTEKKRTDATNKSCVSLARALGYVDDLKKSIASGKIKKESRTVGAKTFKPDTQTCDTCMFFDHKKENKSTCQIIPNCLVQPKGSCNSWVGKA